MCAWWCSPIGTACMSAKAARSDLDVDAAAGRAGSDVADEIDTPSSRASPFSSRAITSFVLKSNSTGSHLCGAVVAGSDTVTRCVASAWSSRGR